MLLWILIALLTAAAIMAVLLPLGRIPKDLGSAGQARRVESLIAELGVTPAGASVQ